MNQKFRIAGPEILGFCMLGAVIGGVLAAALDAGQAAITVPACIAGALMLPLAVRLPWRRLAAQWSAARPALGLAAGSIPTVVITPVAG